MALLVHPVLRKDATQIDLPGLGLAVGLFAASPDQFLWHHGHARAIGTDIHHGRIASAWLRGPFLPSLGAAAHPLDHPLNLARRYRDAAGLLQMPLGFEVGRLIGPFQTNELGQSRGVAHLQTQRRIGRIVALVLTGVVIIIPAQIEAAEDALHPDRFPSLATLSRLGLVMGIDPLGRLLEQPAHQFIG